jgi:cell division septation protein DedD
MNNNDYDADFDQNESVAGTNGLRWMSMLVIVLIIFGFFSLVWYAYNATDMTNPQEVVPTITSDTEDYKVKPEDVGGLRVVNKDIESYELMRRNPDDIEASKVIERLRPEAETPVVIERIEEVRDVALEDIDDTVDEVTARYDAAGNAISDTAVAAVAGAEEKLDVLVNDASVPNVKVIDSTASVEATTSTQQFVASATPSPNTVQPPVVETPEVPVVADPVQEVVTAKIPEPIQKIAEPALPVAKAAPQPVATNNNIYVQLAALRSENEAERLWSKLSAQHSALLGGMSHYVQPVQVVGSGTLYRLRATGMNSHSAAASLCAKLKSRGLTCMSSK